MSNPYPPPPVPPAPVAAAPVDRSAIRPKVGWIVLAVVLLVGGPAGCTAAMAVEVVGLVDDFDEFGSYRLPVEGASLTFDEPVDRVSLYIRGRRASDARLLRDVSIVGPDGLPVNLYLPTGDFTFDHPDGGVLTTVREFSVDRPGTYRLSAEVEPGGEGIELTVGRELLDSVGPTVAVAFALGALSALVGLVLLIVVLVRRGRARRELRGPPPGWIGPPPPPGWTGGPPPGGSWPAPGGPSPAGPWSTPPAPPPSGGPPSGWGPPPPPPPPAPPESASPPVDAPPRDSVPNPDEPPGRPEPPAGSVWGSGDR